MMKQTTVQFTTTFYSRFIFFRLKERLLSRFAVIELKAYDSFEEFKRVTLDVLKNHPLAEFIAQEVYTSATNPNIRDCVRLASLCQTEQDVLRMLKVLRS